MAYVAVQFIEGDGSGIALVSKQWLTPRKKEVYWPPYKNQSRYNKALRCGDTPDEESWTLYPISKCYFENDDIEKSKRKLKLLEESSDIPSSDLEVQRKRKRKVPRRFSSDENSSSADDNQDNELSPPPTLSQHRTTSDSLSSCSNALNNNNTKLSQNYYSSVQLTPPNRSFGLHLTPPREYITSTPSSSRSNEFPSTPQSVQSSELANSGVNHNRLIIILAQLQEQNKEILKILKHQNHTPQHILADNIPVQLPIKSEEDLKKLERFLENHNDLVALSLYFSSLGGREITSQTNSILRHLLSDDVASGYSFKGTRNDKQAFRDLNLNKVVIRAVKLSSTSATERDIENTIKTWLKHAPQRAKKARMNIRNN